jgi:uncharacterized damage-inducible protein DinB
MGIFTRMDGGFVTLFRHHAWASDRLFAACEGLPADHLEFVVQGTFGGLGATLRHLVEAEERYVRGLRGETAPGPDAAGGIDRPVPPEALAPSVRVLRRRAAAAAAAALIELAEAATPDAVVTATQRGEPAVVRAITFFTQALDHGCEHRTQVRHSLTILGYDPPDIDGWAYDEEVLGALPG